VAPVWTPDGREIIFGSTRDGVLNLYRQPADNSRPARRLTVSADEQYPLSVSPDGSQLVVRQRFPANPSFGFDLFLLPLNGRTALNDGGRMPETSPLLSATFGKGNGIISPDGRWIAYESTEDDQFQIYVRPFPDVSQRLWKVSTNGGRSPLWAP